MNISIGAIHRLSRMMPPERNAVAVVATHPGERVEDDDEVPCEEIKIKIIEIEMNTVYGSIPKCSPSTLLQ